MRLLVCAFVSLCFSGAAIGTPNFELVGFATLNASGQDGPYGGSGGTHVQVSTLQDFVKYCETNSPMLVEVMTNIDCSALANHSGGFPGDYPVGEILVNSNKTIYSRNGATIRR